MEKFDYSKVYSYSKLNTFNVCRKQFYFQYIDPEIASIKREFIKPRDYKTKGQAVHCAITLFYHLPVQERTFENLKKCLEKAWFSEVDISKKFPLGELGGFDDLEHEKETIYDAFRILVNFFKLGEIDPPIFYLPTKKIKDSFDDYKNFIKPIEEKTFISGKIDRIDELKDGNLRIVDFKTGKGNQGNFQLEFYKLLVELNFNKEVSIVSYYYLDTGKIKDMDVSDIHSGDIKRKVLDNIENIRNTKNFFPRKSGLCDHCDFSEICLINKINL